MTTAYTAVECNGWTLLCDLLRSAALLERVDDGLEGDARFGHPYHAMLVGNEGHWLGTHVQQHHGHLQDLPATKSTARSEADVGFRLP